MPRPDPLAPPALPPQFIPAPGDPVTRLPLAGLTVLAVEDSRFACDALRLMCQRSGARLRRAATLAEARAHLRTYRPDVVIIDLGLPDGRGEALIRDLTLLPVRRAVVLGCSGEPSGRATALAAGAAGFLEKPIPGLLAFRAAILRHLPSHRLPAPASEGDAAPAPDPLALRDDLSRAAALLAERPDASQRAYVSRFLRGLARHSADPVLERAAVALEAQEAGAEVMLSRVLSRRLHRARSPLDLPQARPGAA